MSPEDLISDNLNLISMPEIVIRLGQMIEDPNCTVADIGNEISLEPSLTVRVLKIVNSALYNLPSKIETIPIAITVIGTKQLHDIVMTTAVIKKFHAIPADLVNMDTYWRHSISAAIAARNIALYKKLNNSDHFFVIGLLHDIGKLVMYLTLPDQSRVALREMNKLGKNTPSPQHDILTVEQKIFGFNHAELGSVLTRKWNMPDSLTIPIAEHHGVCGDNTLTQESAVIHIADYIANQIQPVISPDDDQHILSGCLDILKIDEDYISVLSDETQHLLQETFTIVYTDY